uniref:Uncharacterized protein n=1 Tax=Corethron hystrix TaxID=216773 RepID=A0A7S1BFU3_9STRA|mmetsp:Transcript_23809/g.54252  ORF Transcript_23809/g.54252 Transcript_23809/m.54252 type:complete len:342 (+) Transcript_23809:39-1064(+)
MNDSKASYNSQEMKRPANIFQMRVVRFTIILSIVFFNFAKGNRDASYGPVASKLPLSTNVRHFTHSNCRGKDDIYYSVSHSPSLQIELRPSQELMDLQSLNIINALIDQVLIQQIELRLPSESIIKVENSSITQKLPSLSKYLKIFLKKNVYLILDCSQIASLQETQKMKFHYLFNNAYVMENFMESFMDSVERLILLEKHDISEVIVHWDDPNDFHPQIVNEEPHAFGVSLISSSFPIFAAVIGLVVVVGAFTFFFKDINKSRVCSEATKPVKNFAPPKDGGANGGADGDATNAPSNSQICESVDLKSLLECGLEDAFNAEVGISDSQVLSYEMVKQGLS